MAGELKAIECEPKCGFMVRSHDEKELLQFAIQHAKTAHQMAVTEKDARALMKAVKP
jgi:predicted small metal-binding protein